MSLCSQVKAKEKTKYWREEHHTDNNGNSHTTHVHVVDRNILWQVDLPLLGPGNLGPGNYEFPFNFQLPPQSPGSFEFHGSYNHRDARCSALLCALHAEGFQAACCLLQPAPRHSCCCRVVCGQGSFSQ